MWHKVCKGLGRREAAEDSGSDINLLKEEVKSLRRTTAVMNLDKKRKRTTELRKKDRASVR